MKFNKWFVFNLVFVFFLHPVLFAFDGDVEVIAVLSSGSGSYQEAFEGFQEIVGNSLSPHIVGEGDLKVSAKTKIVAAFGSKAALGNYPNHITLIYTLAPGVHLDPDQKYRQLVHVPMLPASNLILSKIKELQPSCKRLGVFWILETFDDYHEHLKIDAERIGMEVYSGHLTNPENLPDYLREAQGKVDAIWVLPDPILITPQNFSIFKEYSWSNNVPLYAPTEGLVEKGAVASIAPSFQEIGRTVAQVSKQILSNSLNQLVVYPGKCRVVINLTAAANSNLRIPEEYIRRVDRVIP